MDLTIGTWLERPEDEARLAAARFNRHTFWCGQSGSGKTYALGVVLEQLLLKTDLPLLILDPNADFTRLHQTRPGRDPDAVAAITGSDVRILHSTRPHGERLRVTFFDLSAASKAAVLQLDPIADAEEYNVLLHVDADIQTFGNESFLASLRGSNDPGQQRLARRIENLQVLEWELWSRGSTSATQVIDQRPAVTVMDLGGFADVAEPKVAALAVIEHLWNTRESRRPVLIVIDEAHNICPPDPVTAVERALTDRVIQIAAEGRKFGLWLFVSTQRPTKIHPNVLSQCDNLGLMRMNAPRDLAELADVFGFVPEELLARAASFTQGQALFAGGFIGEPTLVQMGERLTEEGGSDVKVPLRPER
ncbi:ATP-binding protein [Occultella kanbiaonis]|uniref:ATP-binding protein n=1 Tax=Occultella kanbiaonis TaxID=2675754 RepID=UPI001F2C9C09|nr:ATP-binding protein [Occultella kanbiaonis]